MQEEQQDSEKEWGYLTVQFIEGESCNDGWTPTPQQLDERLQIKICTLSKLSSVSFKNKGTYLDSHANIVVCGKRYHVLSQSGINATVSAFTNDVGTIQIPIVDVVIV